MHGIVNFLAQYLPDAESARTFLSVVLILVSVSSALKAFQSEKRPLLTIALLSLSISAFIAVFNVYAYPDSPADGAASALDASDNR